LLVLLVIAPVSITEAPIKRTMIRTVLISFFVNCYLNFTFYPTLVRYQAGSEAAMWINQHNPGHLRVIQTDADVPYPMEFYLHQQMLTETPQQIVQKQEPPFLLYGDSTAVTSLSAKGVDVHVLKTLDFYWITRLKPVFLNKQTRAKEIKKTFVVLVTAK
jgi:hypothetical protein